METEHHVEIIPAIMAKDANELNELLTDVHHLAHTVQIDVMDGVFVPHKSWPYAPQGGYFSDFTSILKEQSALPHWEELEYEFDLMIARPEDTIDDWIIGGAKRLIFHLESFEGADCTDRIAKMLGDLRQRFPKEKFAVDALDAVATLEFGLAINVSTPIEELDPFISQIDFVQCMGIEKIGFQAQVFDHRVVNHVSALAKRYPELTISVDGAVSVETAPALVAAGARRLAVGSAIFHDGDVGEAFEELEKAAGFSPAHHPRMEY